MSKWLPPGAYVDPNPQYSYEDWIESWASNRGKQFALNVEVHPGDKIEVGCLCVLDDICSECLLSAACEAEVNDHQGADFIIETKRWGDDDEYGPKFNYWAAFEEHLAKGMDAGVKERLLKKYGEKILFLKSMGADRHGARKARASTKRHGD